MLTITNEDNMDMMARYPDKHFDLAICDPPYGIGMDNSKKRTKRTQICCIENLLESLENTNQLSLF